MTEEDIQRRALDEPRLTLDDLAEATGRSRDTLGRYRLDTANRNPMPADVAQRLAAFLREHAIRLLRLADELERTIVHK